MLTAGLISAHGGRELGNKEKLVNAKHSGLAEGDTEDICGNKDSSCEDGTHSSSVISTASGGGSMSISEILAAELNQVRERKHTETQNVMSINTSIKGVICVKVMRREVCPVLLVKMLFERVKKEKMAITRYCARVIPLKKVFYPNDAELRENIRDYVISLYPGIQLPDIELEEEIEKTKSSHASIGEAEANEETVEMETSGVNTSDSSEVDRDNLALGSTVGSKRELDSASSGKLKKAKSDAEELPVFTDYPPIVYQVSLKTRNHNVFNRANMQATLFQNLPQSSRATYISPKVREGIQ